MPSTSIKARLFNSEGLWEKSVIDLPGVGNALGNKLNEQGFDKAYQVLGKYLELKKNKVKFQEWMKNICEANSKQSADCFQALEAWCIKYL